MALSSPAHVATTWRLVRPNGLVLRRWDGETVVYDPLPGSTHRLDPIASAVLDCLIERDASALEISRSLAGDFGADAEEEVLEAVLLALAKLHHAGLIQTSAS